MTSYLKDVVLAKGRWIALGLFCLYLAASCDQRAEALEPQVVRLWDAAAPGARGEQPADVPTLIIPAAPTPNDQPRGRTALVIFPGGGYGGLAMDHEGQQIAAWCHAHHLAPFVVDYRHRGKGYGHPVPLQDAQRAVRLVRHHAQDWGVDATRVGIIGFSAGGHLASTLGTHADAGRPDDPDLVERQGCRPDFMILCYPVIAFGEPYTHRGSERNLLGDRPTAEDLRYLSNEKQVTPQTPPTFLLHTSADQAVPPENSIVFYAALQRAGVAAELHIYQHGPHGVGLAKAVPGTSSWPDRCLDWLKLGGFLSE